MRHINTKLIESKIPKACLEDLEKAANSIAALPDVKRSKAINKNQNAKLWGKLKPILEEASHGKCWYCESAEDRSDNAVDHFRPKNRVSESDAHDGYWWLAFDWHNYRYSCTFCNSRRTDLAKGTNGGKHDYFPVFDETKRCNKPGDDLKQEGAILLDPASAGDFQLLWFEQDGRVIPRYKENERPNLYKRADKSIELYHLNHTKIEERRRIVYNEIAELVRDGKTYFDRYADNDPIVKHAFERVSELLEAKLSEKSEFSSAARAYLKGLRSDGHPWIDGLL